MPRLRSRVRDSSAAPSFRCKRRVRHGTNNGSVFICGADLLPPQTRRVSKEVMQRIANPSRAVRFRYPPPPIPMTFIFSRRFVSGFVASATFGANSFLLKLASDMGSGRYISIYRLLNKYRSRPICGGGSSKKLMTENARTRCGSTICFRTVSFMLNRPT